MFFYKKLYEKIENKIKEQEQFLKNKLEVEIDRISESIKKSFSGLADNIDDQEKHWSSIANTIKEHAKTNEELLLNRLDNLEKNLQETNKLYKEYHGDILEKMNKAGELIVSYENFYESVLSELDEIFKFIALLEKRPSLSSDPDFVNFSRAVQIMSSVISKYSSIGETVSKIKNEAETESELKK